MSESHLTMTTSAEEYRARRARLAALIRRPLVILAGHAPARNYATNPYPFRAASTYLYFGGPPVEHAAMIIEPSSDGDDGCTLCRPAPGADDPLWLGETPSDGILADASGIAWPRIVDCDAAEPLLAGRKAAGIVPPYPRSIARAERLGLDAPTEEEMLAIINMRLIKDAGEIAAMRQAADAGIDAHRAAMSATVVGRTEDDVEAALTGALVRHRCRPSFSSIVTMRGEVLHGASAGRKLTPGALMLVDAGAEASTGYASDITRTFPVSGEWTPIQRQLYDTVLRAEREAIAACLPGRRYREVHTIAARCITAGLIEAELLRGDVDDLTERGVYTLFFPHGVGHLLGLDVHDMEDFGDLAGYAPGRQRPERFGDCFLRLDRDLAPGMVVTIEPGIYLVPAIWRRDDLVGPFADAVNRPAVDALLADAFGGIRIEDDVHVRDASSGGPEVLTAALPVGADEVAGLVGA